MSVAPFEFKCSQAFRPVIGVALMCLCTLAVPACSTPKHQRPDQTSHVEHDSAPAAQTTTTQTRSRSQARSGGSGPVVNDYIDNERSNMAREDQHRSAESLEQSKAEQQPKRAIRNEPLMPTGRRP